MSPLRHKSTLLQLVEALRRWLLVRSQSSRWRRSADRLNNVIRGLTPLLRRQLSTGGTVTRLSDDGCLSGLPPPLMYAPRHCPRTSRAGSSELPERGLPLGDPLAFLPSGVSPQAASTSTPKGTSTVFAAHPSSASSSSASNFPPLLYRSSPPPPSSLPPLPTSLWKQQRPLRRRRFVSSSTCSQC